MKRNGFYSRLVLAGTHDGQWERQAFLRHLQAQGALISQKEGEDISATVLPTFYQGPCHPQFAKSPGKLLPQALSKAVILYFHATVDPHAVTFVDSHSLKGAKERNVLSIPEYCLASWPKMKRQRTSTAQHTFLWFAQCHLDTDSREAWWPGCKMIPILPCSVCILPLFPEAVTAHLLPQSVALLETWLAVPLRDHHILNCRAPQMCPSGLVPSLGFSNKLGMKLLLRPALPLWTWVLVLSEEPSLGIEEHLCHY